MRHPFIFCLVVLLCFAFPVAAQAQDAAIDEKRQLINELIKLTESTVNFKQEFMESFEDQRRISRQAMADEDLPLEKKEDRERLNASMDRMFARITERVSKEIDFDAYANKFLYETYDKHYSVSEIKELIVFYKSPIGQKVLKAMPLILSDSKKAAEAELLPKIMKITKEITDEEMKEIMKEFESLTDEDTSDT